MRKPTAAVAALVLAACGGGDSDPDARVVSDAPPGVADARSVDAAPPVDAGGCLVLEDCSWLVAYQQEIVAKLTGVEEIAAGTTITRRASSADRAIVRTYLLAEFERWGYTPTLHQYSASGANVVAVLPATSGDDDSILIVGGHFDGVPAGPAAADNATGSAVTLAAARYLATVADRTHEIRFVLFDQEEIGLVGSGEYADQLIADGTVVAGVHNFDMISFDGDGDRAIELWTPAPALEQAYRDVAAPLGVPVHPFTFGSSDHQSFVSAGFPAVGVSEEYVGGDSTDYYHTSGDTYARVNFEYLGMVTEVALTVLRTSIEP